MINRGLKNLLLKIVAALFVLSCVCALAFNPNASKVKASETASEIAKLEGFDIANGAYVRIPESDSDKYGVTDENGIRFTFYLSDSIAKDSIEKISTLVSVDTAITDLTIENVTGTNGKVTEKVWDKDNIAYDSETNKYTQNIDLVNFPMTEYHSEVTVRGYIKTTEGEYYTDQLTRTMAGVANYHAINVSEDAEALSAYIGTEKSSNGDCGFAVVNKEATLSVNGLSGVTEATAVYINQHKAAGVTVNNGNVTIPASVTKTLTSGETYTLSVFENDGVHRAEFKAIDYAIGTATEFVEFLTAIKNDKPINAILTADIDYKSISNYKDTRTHTSNSYFKGVLDGQGHTIDNVYAANGIFFGINGATVKNIAFTNITTSRTGSTSLYAWNTSGNNSLENVLLHGDLSNVTATTAGISNNTSSIGMNNVVVYVEFAKGSTFNAINRSGSLGSLSNVHVISATAAKLSDAATITGATLYASAYDYAEVATEAIKNFDTDYWTTEGGVLMFKSAKAKLPAVDSGSIIDKSSFIKVGEAYNAIKGTYNVAISGCATVIDQATTGVTLADNLLTIGSDAVVGSKFTLTAYDLIYGTEIDSVEVTVAAVQELTSKGGVVGKNRSGKITVNLNEGLTAANLNNVSFGGTAVSASDYTVADNKLEVNSDNLATTEKASLSATFVKDGTIYNYIVTDVKVCDFAIGTEAEFTDWVNAVRATTYTNDKSTKAYYVVLTDNVTMTTVYGNDSDGDNGTAEGVFDGQGYTVTGVSWSGYGLFEKYSTFTIKNVAFVNMQSTRTSGMSYIFYQGHTALIFENVYLDATFATNNGQIGIGNNGSSGWAFTNSVIRLTYTASNMANNTNVPAFRAGAPKLNNTFVISGQPLMYPADKTPVTGSANYGLYADTNALKAALEAENATVTLNGFTNNEYWDVTAGYPVWKTKNA